MDENNNSNVGTIEIINIENELKNSFLDYSMSVIVSRALPDVRDGLKPVHRRILYAMYNLKNYHNRPYLKSARIVGDVIGKYHPHGDNSVYDALVRLAQEFSMRYTLADGQGNFGSIDGDSAAAMRYTEVRMSEITSFMLTDIEKDTVDFVPNYDNKEMEPVVLPTKVPQLLINGGSGIAVGMATNMPPHNIGEVASALLALVEDPDISIKDIITHIQGPDFPTGGLIYGRGGITQAYLTGKGSIIMRAKTEIEHMDKQSSRERIVISEIPYQVNKARLIEKIADLVKERRIEGISDIRDESSKLGIRIVIDLKKGEMGEILLNNLFKLTPLQSSFSVNNVALVNGVPRLLNIKEILSEFYSHRKEVIVRRTIHELRKAEEKAHVLIGLKKAVENVDDVVSTIRAANDTQIACDQLMQKFDLTVIQAKAILDMRLARLTGLEREKIVEEYNEIQKLIEDLNDILNTPQRVVDIIKADLLELKETFGDSRKTEIIATQADELTMEKLVSDDAVAVAITVAGYVKRTPITSIQAQKRGGKGRSGMLTKEEDVVRELFTATNHQSLLVFTNIGKVYNLKVYQIPEAELRSRGKHIANLITFSEGEKVVSILPVREFSEGSSVVSITRSGYIKKTDLLAYENVRVTGIIGLKLDDDDDLVKCTIVDNESHIVIGTAKGKAIRFESSKVRNMGRASRGVTGIRLEKDDKVIGMEILDAKENHPILTVCENGYGKRTSSDEYRVQSRGGKGIFTIKVTERNGNVVGIMKVTDDDDIVMMTSAGKIMRYNAKEINIIGRNTQGVRLMNIDSSDEKIIGFCRTDSGEENNSNGDELGESESADAESADHESDES